MPFPVSDQRAIPDARHVAISWSRCALHCGSPLLAMTDLLQWCAGRSWRRCCHEKKTAHREG
eukprot:23350-Eustigmatos_ZCMA.PRE.1